MNDTCKYSQRAQGHHEWVSLPEGWWNVIFTKLLMMMQESAEQLMEMIEMFILTQGVGVSDPAVRGAKEAVLQQHYSSRCLGRYHPVHRQHVTIVSRHVVRLSLVLPLLYQLRLSHKQIFTTTRLCSMFIKLQAIVLVNIWHKVNNIFPQ